MSAWTNVSFNIRSPKFFTSYTFQLNLLSNFLCDRYKHENPINCWQYLDVIKLCDAKILYLIYPGNSEPRQVSFILIRIFWNRLKFFPNNTLNFWYKGRIWVCTYNSSFWVSKITLLFAYPLKLYTSPEINLHVEFWPGLDGI